MTFLIALITPKWFSSIFFKKLRQKTLKTPKTQVCHIAKLAVFTVFANLFQYFWLKMDFEAVYRLTSSYWTRKVNQNFFLDLFKVLIPQKFAISLHRSPNCLFVCKTGSRPGGYFLLIFARCQAMVWHQTRSPQVIFSWRWDWNCCYMIFVIKCPNDDCSLVKNSLRAKILH